MTNIRHGFELCKHFVYYFLIILLVIYYQLVIRLYNYAYVCLIDYTIIYMNEIRM